MNQKGNKMFIQKCFVKDCSQYLCDALEQRGYRKNTLCSFENAGDNPEGDVGIACENGTYFLVNESCLLSDFVNCGNNRSLFISVASLQDTSDKYQWFKFSNEEVGFCECESHIDMWGDYEEGDIPPIKLSVKELIDMFRDKKNKIFFSVDKEGWGWFSETVPVRSECSIGWRFCGEYYPVPAEYIKFLGFPELAYQDDPVEIEVSVKVK